VKEFFYLRKAGYKAEPQYILWQGLTWKTDKKECSSDKQENTATGK